VYRDDEKPEELELAQATQVELQPHQPQTI
jgi:hypothetical protein